jgi:hypothetical protein
MWWLAVENFGNIAAIAYQPLPGSTTTYVLFNALSSLAVYVRALRYGTTSFIYISDMFTQSFFIWRLRKATGQKVAPIFLSLLLLARVAGNLGLVVFTMIIHSNIQLLTEFRSLLLSNWIIGE